MKVINLEVYIEMIYKEQEKKIRVEMNNQSPIDRSISYSEQQHFFVYNTCT